ncbi:MAG: HAD-IIIA family hydrolase [Desulfobacterales bacterium]|nr:HAD-IIIA family hydrolase [Desulfobacterales bacterium]
MVVDKLKRIKLLLLDVDGVLTDGSIIYNDNAGETKVFNVKDGLGIRLLIEEGIAVCVVTGRTSKALLHRCKNLGISYVFDGVVDKVSVMDSIITRTGVLPEEIAFIGDDLPDLPLMKLVGFSVAVADAHEKLLEKADMVTSAKGGFGAVREVCEAILKAKGLLEDIIRRF